MEATLGTFDQYSHSDSRRLGNLKRSLGNWLTAVFGCSHKQLSRPFSRHGESYRVCIACGARRGFDDQTWNSRGSFYYKPANTSELLEVDCTALRSV
jgi:hypothetical protein